MYRVLVKEQEDGDWSLWNLCLTPSEALLEQNKAITRFKFKFVRVIKDPILFNRMPLKAI